MLLQTSGRVRVAAVMAQSEVRKIPFCQHDLIESLCEADQLDRAVDALSNMTSALSDRGYLCLLEACNKSRSFLHAKRVHLHLVQHKLKVSCYLGAQVVLTLAKCGAIHEAWQMLSRLDRRTVFSWTAIISAYVDSGHVREAFKVYQQMRKDGVEPDDYTFVTLFKACGNIADLARGKKLHVEANQQGFASDVFVSNSLITMYARCGAVDEAEAVFYGMLSHNIVSWCSMLCAYVDHGQGKKALLLYRQLQQEDVSPDARTFVFAFQACGILADEEKGLVVGGRHIKAKSLEMGRALHSDARRKGFLLDVFVATALLGMYSKCGAIAEGEHVIQALDRRGIISWNAMVTAYVEGGQGIKALWAFNQAQKECIQVDDVTIVCALQASREFGFLEICKNLHFEIVCAGLDEIAAIEATLIHAYGRSASTSDAWAIFNELSEPHMAAWNAWVAVDAGQEEGDLVWSIHAFEAMNLASLNVRPDEVSFLLVFSACSYGGLVKQALEYFDSMRRHFRLVPDFRHFGAMVNLFGRAGDFRHLKSMLDRMPTEANLTMCLGLLGACCTHGNLGIAEEAFKQAVCLQPQLVAPYIMMWNILANAGVHQYMTEGVAQSWRENCSKEWAELDD